MRWNCPHCRTQLETADDEVSSSWSFALCAHCSRFGLIRKSSRLAVKVDRAPPGERFIRAAITGPLPEIRPAQLRRQDTTATAPTSISTPTPTPAPLAAAAQQVLVSQTQRALHSEIQQKERKFLEARLPEPLPEIPVKRRFSLSRFVFFGCAALLAWNGYRYHRLTKSAVAETTTDTITANAMAPQEIGVGSRILPRTLNALIRNNPGHQFPVIGALDPSLRYSVLEVQSETDGQWYRVDAGTQSQAWVSIQDVSPAN